MACLGMLWEGYQWRFVTQMAKLTAITFLTCHYFVACVAFGEAQSWLSTVVMMTRWFSNCECFEFDGKIQTTNRISVHIHPWYAWSTMKMPLLKLILLLIRFYCRSVATISMCLLGDCVRIVILPAKVVLIEWTQALSRLTKRFSHSKMFIWRDGRDIIASFCTGTDKRYRHQHPMHARIAPWFD